MEENDLFSFANRIEEPAEVLEQMVEAPLSQESLRRLRPLAERLRPTSFDELLEIPEALRSHLLSGALTSFIFWGPPGSGKTSLISVLKAKHRGPWYEFLASDVTIKELRSLIEKAQLHFRNQRKASVLVLDEIHRLNRVHQDALLPSLEKGEIVLIGGTTENPLTCLTKAFISRCRLWNLQPLSKSSLQVLYRRALADLNHVGEWLDSSQLNYLIQRSHGDARLFLRELHTLYFRLSSEFESRKRATQKSSPIRDSSEAQDPSATRESSEGQDPSATQESSEAKDFLASQDSPEARFIISLSAEEMDSLLGQQDLGFEPGSSDQSQAISGLIKNLRASEPDRALGWLTMMLQGRVDPIYICRRLMIFASEDIGNADPRALGLATDAAKATEMVGLPEARIILSQVVCYLASAPKSRSSYEAIGKAEEWVRTQPILKLKETLAPQSQLMLPQFYEPSNSGFEKNIRELAQWRKDRQQSSK